MITVSIVVGRDEDEEDWGRFEFAEMPRAGEHMMVYHQRRSRPLIVEAVYHYPHASDDPSPRVASVILRCEPDLGT